MLYMSSLSHSKTAHSRELQLHLLEMNKENSDAKMNVNVVQLWRRDLS